MNNGRRKEIRDVLQKIEDLSGLIEEIKTDIEFIQEEEQGCLDNIPENLQGSERYERAETAVENLQSAVDILEELDIEQLTEHMETAMLQ